MLASIYLEDINKGNWRAIALWNALPCFILTLGSIFLIDESARFLLVCYKYEDSFNIINKMIK